MPFQTLAKSGKGSSLFTATALSARQMTVVQEIINFCGATKITRAQLREAHATLHGRPLYGPHFIVKNLACKVKGQPGVYDLSQLKLAGAERLAEETTEVMPGITAPVTTVKEVVMGEFEEREKRWEQERLEKEAGRRLDELFRKIEIRLMGDAGEKLHVHLKDVAKRLNWSDRLQSDAWQNILDKIVAALDKNSLDDAYPYVPVYAPVMELIKQMHLELEEKTTWYLSSNMRKF